MCRNKITLIFFKFIYIFKIACRKQIPNKKFKFGLFVLCNLKTKSNYYSTVLNTIYGMHICISYLIVF